jgi:hypothetical protein
MVHIFEKIHLSLEGTAVFPQRRVGPYTEVMESESPKNYKDLGFAYSFPLMRPIAYELILLIVRAIILTLALRALAFLYAWSPKILFSMSTESYDYG